MRGFGLWLCCVVMWGSVAWAQEGEEDEPILEGDEELFGEGGLGDGEGAEPLGSPGEMEAVDAVDAGEYVRARKLAEEILKQNPNSIPGLYALSSVFHYGESNLPKALHLIREARERCEGRYGKVPSERLGKYWYFRIVQEEVYLTGDMDLREDQLAVLKIRDKQFDNRPADKIWPLIKLERWDEAMEAVDEALASDDFDQKFRGMNSHCALEFERRRRVASYEACLKMAQRFDYSEVGWSNTAESAMMVFKHDEAEEFYLKATERPNDSYGTPWRSLAMIYLLEGRTSEALSALKSAQQQRQARQPHTWQQDQGTMDMAVTNLLLALGRSEEGVKMGRRVFERPDRAGSTSASQLQLSIAGGLLFWTSLKMRVAEMEEERASRPWYIRLWPDREREQLELEAWTVERRVVRLMAFQPEIIEMTRPYLTGITNVESWEQGTLVYVLGPGVAQAVVDQAREEEDHEDAEGYFLGLEAEIALANGDEAQALEKVVAANKKLPRAEVMLRARLAAVGGEAARRLGKDDLRDKLWNQALEDFPAVFRLLDLAIPIEVEHGDSDLEEQVAEAIARSPRFVVEEGGLKVTVKHEGEVLRTCLYRAHNALHACAETPVKVDEDATTFDASKAFHAVIMSPKLDLTQADIRSLDGSPSTGRARKEVDDLLKDVSGPPPG